MITTKDKDIIISMHLSGVHLKSIASVCGVSFQAVSKNLQKWGIESDKGGYRKSCQIKKLKNKAKRNKEYLDKYGCCYAEYWKILKKVTPSGQTPQRCFRIQKKNSIQRGIDWEFSFYQWWMLWQSSGKWEERGRELGGYVMCRYGDSGPYSQENTYIDTCTNNIKNGIELRMVARKGKLE